MNITRDDLVDFQTVHIDPVGDIYEYKGHILRVIRKNSRRYVLHLMESGLIERLMKEKLLVETRVSEYVFEDGGWFWNIRRLSLGRSRFNGHLK